MDAVKQPNQSDMCPVSHELPPPDASSAGEISGEDFETLLRIANDPDAPKGRLKIVPRRIPLIERETANG